VKIGNHCSIGPNVVISGRTTIGDLVFIGAGATVINRIKICSQVVIGAGATVVKNIEEPGIYVGIPAKKIKKIIN
jgi:acetyltransferase-like isoleucine patch superfamily enzyme